MGIFNRKKKEDRAFDTMGTSDSAEDVLLSALLDKSNIDKNMALNIPSLTGAIGYIANTVSMLPIKLYKEDDGKVTEIKNDIRLKILNDDTGDTLDSVQFWNALIRDYFLGKGGYAYINKVGNKFKSLHYVREEDISIQKNTDPIFKDYDILVSGEKYMPFDFIKILRNSKDGASGTSIITESPTILSVAYNTLTYENNLVYKGGNKRGFLKSAKKLSDVAMDALKTAFKALYNNNEENVIVLNDGIDFKEASNTSVEMQLNENKETNSVEICKILNVPESIINGKATEKDYISGFKLGVKPILRVIESALNRDFLLEKEKKSFYFAFDTKELTRGDILARYQAYEIAIKNGFMQWDEVRYQEDYEPYGVDFIKLGLQDVLYNPKTKEIYTPNTNQTQNMNDLKGGEIDENRNS